MLERFLPTLSEPALRWVRFTALVLVLAVLCWIAYGLRTVFTPLVAALALAYIVNPVVTWFEHRHKVSRLVTVIVAFVLLGALLVGGGLYLGSKTLAQVELLQEKIPGYVETLGRWSQTLQSFATTAPAATSPTAASAPTTAPGGATAAADAWALSAALLKAHGVALARSVIQYLTTGVSSFAALLSLLVLVPMYTFFFLWRFNDIVAGARAYLPVAYREPIIHVVQTIDRAVASFFRGRLIVCLVLGVITSIGWSLVDVPYALPLGVLTGVLNLVPFLSLLTLPPALFFAYLAAAEAGHPWAWPVSLTMGVFVLVQALDSFLLSPYVLGRSASLHPLVIVVALLIGGQLAGLLGLLLAIPVASTLRTLGAEWLVPEFRRLAGMSPPGDAPPKDTPQ